LHAEEHVVASRPNEVVFSLQAVHPIFSVEAPAITSLANSLTAHLEGKHAVAAAADQVPVAHTPQTAVDPN